MQNIHVFITISDIHLKSGGTSASVVALSEALSTNGYVVSLYTLAEGDEPLALGSDKPPFHLSMEKVEESFWGRVRAVRDVSITLRQALRNTDNSLIHDNGIWLPMNRMVTKIAIRTQVPLIVSTHGMMEPWALSYKKYKKKLAWFLYQKQNLKAAQVLHATAEKEAKNLRTLGIRKPIAIVPNGVTFPILHNFSKLAGECRTVLFLSRIHPVKGLEILVESWSKIRPEGWRVVVAGPNDHGYMKQVQRLIDAKGLTRSFEFIGAVFGDEKWSLMASADIFVLPSLSENFGIVVAEALLAEVPVITTKGTPWKDLVDHHCGWWVETGVEPLVAGLREAISLSDEQRREMGKRGRKLIESSYSWSKIAANMKNVYEWILGGGSPPSCVMTD